MLKLLLNPFKSRVSRLEDAVQDIRIANLKLGAAIDESIDYAHKLHDQLAAVEREIEVNDNALTKAIAYHERVMASCGAKES